LRNPPAEIKHYLRLYNHSLDTVRWKCTAVAAPGERLPEAWNKWMGNGKDIPGPGKLEQVFEQFDREMYRKRSESENRRRHIFHVLHARNHHLQHEIIAHRHDDEKTELLSDG